MDGHRLSSSVGIARRLGVSGRRRCGLDMDAGPRSLVVVLSLLAVECSPDGLARKAAQEGFSLTGGLPSCEDGRCVLALSVAAACLGRWESDLVGWSQSALARQSSVMLGSSATALQLVGF